MKPTLIIEGAANTDRGDLRSGFVVLLRKVINNKPLRFKMGNGKASSIDNFHNITPSLLLVDLDGAANTKAQALNVIDRNRRTEIFFMIIEMESWFLSQPEILDKYYGIDIARKLPANAHIVVIEPDKEIQKHTKGTRRGEYHKVQHGAQLLQLLEPNKLAQDFADFQDLITKINSL